MISRFQCPMPHSIKREDDENYIKLKNVKLNL